MGGILEANNLCVTALYRQQVIPAVAACRITLSSEPTLRSD